MCLALEEDPRERLLKEIAAIWGKTETEVIQAAGVFHEETELQKILVYSIDFVNLGMGLVPPRFLQFFNAMNNGGGA